MTSTIEVSPQEVFEKTKSRADLTYQNLVGKNFSSCDLREASFFAADLSYADLSGSDLFKADLRSSNLGWANLEGANLEGANLSAATLTRAKGVRYFDGGKGLTLVHKSKAYTWTSGTLVYSYIGVGGIGGTEISVPLEEWEKNYEALARNAGHTESEIEMYKDVVLSFTRDM